VTDLAQRGPLGQKQPKAAKKRKAVRKVSAKRAAYLASDDRRAALEHMAKVKALPCICCGNPPPNHAHHVTGDRMPRNDMRVLPLCYECHQGPHGYHAAKRSWVARHGPDYLLLDAVADMLARYRPKSET
jgi:hypothetical protein